MAETGPKSRENSALRREMAEVMRRVEEAEAARVYQLAFWPDDERAMPTQFLSCALFTSTALRGAKSRSRFAELASINGYRIRAKGRVLTQAHADVWQGIMYLARGKSQGDTIRFSARFLLRLIGRKDGGSNHRWLYESITDLAACVVELSDTDNRRVFFGPLVEHGAAAEKVGDSEYVIQVSRHLCKLFQDGSFATINWEQRKKLRGKAMALWLQHYFSHFTKPVHYSDLYKLSGSSSSLKEFRRGLGNALPVLAQAGIHAAEIGKDGIVRPCKSRPAPAGQGSLGFESPPKNPVVFEISAAARRKFAALAPDLSSDACLADFQYWLTDTERGIPGNPDRAFLGFAQKSWIPQQRKRSKQA